MGNILEQQLMERAQQMHGRCFALDRALVYSHETALVLCGIELPWTLQSVEQAELHTVVSQASRRRRKLAGTRPHVWQGLRESDVCDNRGILQVRTPIAIATCARRVNVPRLCLVMGSAVRFGRCNVEDLQRVADERTFHGRQKFIMALRMLQLGGASLQEDRLQLSLNMRGLPWFSKNYEVPEQFFPSGVPMTLDLAVEGYQVGAEYQGDQHRTDKEQFRRDLHKLNTLRAAGWVVFEVSADDMKDVDRLDQLAKQMIQAINERGGKVEFKRLTCAQYCDQRRAHWQRGRA